MNQQKPMVSVEEALDIILSKISSTDIETIPLAEARNRINAHDICSDIDLAPFDNSAMDGFALRVEGIQAASAETPTVLDVVTNIGAGDFFDGEIGKGQAARIMTGAPLPQGANAVELIENAHTSRNLAQGDTVAITRPLSHGENVRRAGEEAHTGDIVVPQNTVLSPAFIGLCASAGAATLAVYKKPRVGIISLGSELIDITKMPDRSHIRNSNSYLLSAAVEEADAIPIVYGVVEDDKESITKAILQATKECDFVLTTGGASMGDFDYVAPIAESQGELFFHFVNMRPGKSQIFAIINETPFLGLAGNPSATAVGFEILARPALRKMQGAQHIFRPVQDARVVHPITKKAKRRHYMRGVAYRNEYDELIVEQAGSQSSAQLSALAHGNCLMMIMPDQIPVETGEEIEIIRIDLPDGAAL